MDRRAAEKALIKIAKQTAATWQRVRGEAFLGDVTIETGNTLYKFKDGVFAGRARQPSAGSAPVWESPASMAGVELIGFLANEDGLWSLSPGWRSGALAVITTNAKAFTLTSPTLACTIVRPADALREPPQLSDVLVAPSQPPRVTVRHPAPPSMTRILQAALS